MRDKLDDLRFKFFELTYAVGVRYQSIPDRLKYSVVYLSLAVCLILCAFVFNESRNYKAKELPETIVINTDVAEETLTKSDLLVEEEKYAEAFNLLATHRNNFSSEYSKSDLERLETRLVDLSANATEGDIAKLYEMKDLTEHLALYKFIGMVVEIDNDPLYGVTYTVSSSGSRTQEQLEVSGLENVSVNSQVEFFGVPTFSSVTSPIKVEAYVVPLE